MKILYVSQHYPPEMGALAGRASELARHWAAEGHDSTVLTGFPNHPTGVIAPEYRSRFRRGFFRERVDAVNVARTWLLPYPNRKPLERVLNYTSFCASASVTGSFLPRPQVVIGTSPPLLIAVAGYVIARVKRVPFVFEVRDLWPESLEGVGMGSKGSAIYKVVHRIVKFLYKHSDHLVVVTPAFKDHIVKHWGVAPERISLVYNGVETETFSPGPPPADLRRRFGLEGKFVASYIGTMGMAHGLETLLEAAALLKDKLPDLVFLMVGDGAYREKLAAGARARGLDNVMLVEQQPREAIPDIVRMSDACLVLLKNSEVFKTVIPTKMLEFMACGKPSILGVDGQAREILEEGNAGIYIEPENAKQLAAALVRLHDDPALREEMGRNARRHVVAKLSRSSTAEEYIRVLERVCGLPQSQPAAVVVAGNQKGASR